MYWQPSHLKSAAFFKTCKSWKTVAYDTWDTLDDLQILSEFKTGGEYWLKDNFKPLFNIIILQTHTTGFGQATKPHTCQLFY